MINNNYSAGLVSTSFKGAEKKGVEKALEGLRSVSKSIESMNATQRLVNDPFVAPSEKFKAMGSKFGNGLAKVLKWFGY